METGGVCCDAVVPAVQHGGAVALRWRRHRPGDGADCEEAWRISSLIPPNCDLQRARGASTNCNLQSQYAIVSTQKNQGGGKKSA